MYTGSHWVAWLVLTWTIVFRKLLKEFKKLRNQLRKKWVRSRDRNKDVLRTYRSIVLLVKRSKCHKFPSFSLKKNQLSFKDYSWILDLKKNKPNCRLSVSNLLRCWIRKINSALYKTHSLSGKHWRQLDEIVQITPWHRFV